ncbi:hypothetical protein F4859DRAFT_522994 [Xylaria cf. heliscus]|nr:hypothetical protein F4859DRAFT_522994 [Xylaria cf. heliscus]
MHILLTMGEAKLSSRYEIRPLELKHLEWTKAIFAHSFVFGSPIWRKLYPLDKTARFYGLYQASDYLIKHQITSGLSLGIFDTEYRYKNPASVASGGGLYLDFSDASADEHTLLRQMDTPLVSIACAFDAFYAMDTRCVAPVAGRLPGSASFHEALAFAAAAAAQTEGLLPLPLPPTAPGQVLQRMGTATRADAEGVGFMKAAAHHMMRRAADLGFRTIQIECFHDAVTAVWANPPLPFKGSVAGEVDTYALDERDEQTGARRFPFRPVRQRLTRVYVTLG